MVFLCEPASDYITGSWLSIDGGMARCVRILMHLYTDRTRDELHHVYLEGARSLRDDLPE